MAFLAALADHDDWFCGKPIPPLTIPGGFLLGSSAKLTGQQPGGLLPFQG
jgi:hypothetical protein